ncbi:Transporter, EamA family [Pseudomonas coronafaciens pv. atropurpurea]|nr:Transporter, EamA family [Pseudomonas coronafaciens pv. atropurpurea]
MIYKAFSFQSAPEVGRIIDRSQRASTVNSQISLIPHFNTPCDDLYRKESAI